MQIDILLQDPRGDEIGVLELEAVRLVAAGVETAPPDLSGQMAQLVARIGSALAGLNFAPVLDPLGVRIAVSRALLNAPPGGVSILLQVRSVHGGETATEAREQTPKPSSSTVSTNAGGSAPDEWEGLFALGPEEAASFEKHGTAASGSTGLSDQSASHDQLASREPFDQWTALGDIWAMDDEGGVL